MIVAQQAIPDVTDSYCTHLIYRAAKRLICEGSIRRRELNDIVQDMRLALIEQANNFDPEIATWSTFVKTVVHHAAVSLRRHRYAACRQEPIDLGTLHILIIDSDGHKVEFGNTVSEEEFRTGNGVDTLSHAEQIENRQDVQQCVSALTSDLQHICHLLSFYSQKEAAQRAGLSLKELQTRMKTIRRHFHLYGLDELPYALPQRKRKTKKRKFRSRAKP